MFHQRDVSRHFDIVLTFHGKIKKRKKPKAEEERVRSDVPILFSSTLAADIKVLHDDNCDVT